jgi:hypothetical protein
MPNLRSLCPDGDAGKSGGAREVQGPPGRERRKKESFAREGFNQIKINKVPKIKD